MNQNFKYSILLFLISFCLYSQNEEWYVVPTIPSNMALRKINIMPDGEIWLGSYNDGAKRLVNNSWVTYNEQNSGISDDDVREISKDAEGNYWLTTWNNLSKFNPTNNLWEVFNVTGQSLDILYSIEIDNQGRRWVGTDGGSNSDDGLYLMNTGEFFNAANSPLDSNWITFLDTDLQGKIWAGGKSIVKIDGTNMTGTNMQSIGFPVNTVATAIDFNSSNHIWLAVYDGGIAYFNGLVWTIYTASNSGLPENKIWSLTVDQNDNVWIGTENSGLVRFDGITWTTYNTSNSPITNNRIDALNCDNQNNIWIAPNYGGLIVYNQDGIASVKGNVFYDLNSDNIRQNTEPPVKNAVIALSPGEYYAVTDAEGNYKANILQQGSYTVSAHPQHNYVVDVFPQQVPVNFNATIVPITQNFAVHLESNIKDIAVSATALNVARPGFSTLYSIVVTNAGTVPLENLSVQLQLDNVLSLIQASDNPTINGNTITWTISNLDIGEDKNFELLFMVPANTNLIGNTIGSSISCVLSDDINLSNNNYIISQLIVGSYDPNDKVVTPVGEGSSGNIPLETEFLDYTVRFQNTGTYEAWRVIIKDQISEHLDLTTLKTIASSHDYEITISDDRTISWVFNNINLPYSSMDELRSNGFVRYIISPKQDVAYGDVIHNLANIYFDYNPPIITNETTNTFYDFTLSVDVSNKEILRVYPNPVKENLLIESEKSMFPLKVVLYDQTGKVLQENVLLESGSITIVNHNKGIIYYTIFTSDKKTVGSGKLIIN